MTLEEWLDSNCTYLEMAVRDVKIGGDLQPMFAAIKDGEPLIFGVDVRQLDKDVVVGIFRAALRALQADYYAIVCACWFVKVAIAEGEAATEIIHREGTGGVYKAQRREAYIVNVGDRERSLVALFEVERDWKGKIGRLIRQAHAPKELSGRFVDLLVERTVH